MARKGERSDGVPTRSGSDPAPDASDDATDDAVVTALPPRGNEQEGEGDKGNSGHYDRGVDGDKIREK